MRQAGRCLPEYRAIRKHHTLVEITRRPELCAEVTLQPVERFGVDAAILFADITLPFFGMGVAFEIKPGVGPVVEEPVRTAAQIDALRAEPPEAYVPELLQAILLIRDRSPVPLIGFAGAPFTLASYLVEGRPTRKFRHVKALMHDNPTAWETLMGHLTAVTRAYLEAQVKAGVEAIQLFDSWVGALSPFDYRAAIQPHVRALLDGWEVPTIHFGTGTAGLLPEMASAGGDVIGLDWRIDLDDGWRRVGERAVQGNLDPHAALGSWEAAEPRARAVLEAAGGRAGHIFNLGHGVLPDTPPEHLERLVDFVHQETEA